MMKQTWSEINQKLENQKILNEQLIIKMTHEHTSNRLNRMVYFEIANIVCGFFVFLWIIPRFNKLDSFISYWSGIGLIAFGIVYLILSLIFLRKASKVNLQRSKVNEVLKSVYELKSFFHKKVYVDLITGLLAAFCAVILAFKLYHHKDIIADFHLFIIPIIIASMAMILSYFIYKRIYEKNMLEVEAMIKESDEK